MKTRFNRFTMITAITALSLFALSPAFATNYIITGITDLGTFGGTESQALGVNNLDEIVGVAKLPGDLVYHAFLYKGGVMTDLGTANCTYPYGISLAWRINDSGQIAGQSCFLTPQGNYRRAALYSGGVWTNLGTLGGGDSIGRGINNWGHVVGWAATPGDATTHAFLYKDGVMNDIGILISAFCCNLAYAINDSDQIVGQYRTIAAGNAHAFLYSGGVTTDLTPGLGCCSAAYDINNSGQVVGTTYFPGTVTHPFLYSGGVLSDLGGLGGPHPEAEGEALGINDQGQIVGWSFVPGTIPHAFIYSDGIMTDLNNILPSNSGWELNYALDINDNGTIVGGGTIDGQFHAFLATISVVKAPHATVDPPLVQFNDVPVGSFAEQTVIIGNTGDGGLNLTNPMGPSLPFEVITGTCPDLPYSLNPGDSCTIKIRFTPTAAGSYSSSISANTNDPDKPVLSIPLHGTGVVPDITVTPTTVSFGKWLKGSSSDLSITVQNDGGAPLTISGIGSPLSPFSVTGGTCSASKILAAHGGNCTIDVEFAPASQGPASSSFNIASDDPDEPSLTVHLTGQGLLLKVDPDEGTIGTEVVITGAGFGASKGKVLIGGVAPKITEWTPSEIKGTLSKAPTPDIASDVVVQPKVPKRTPAIPEPGAFTARGPKITSVDPGSGVSGSTSPITIHGDYSSTKKGKVTLKRGGVVKSCKVLSWTMNGASNEGTIQFLVPKKLTAATDYTLRVSNKVGSDTRGFTVTAP